jgi:hypothetical protein
MKGTKTDDELLENVELVEKDSHRLPAHRFWGTAKLLHV